MSLTLGTRLGAYEIRALIGSGGMGEVYRARDHRLDRDVAVKILPAALAGDPDRLQRFEREARAAAAINHPNVVAVYDVGVADGFPFLVTELLAGETLRQRIDARPLNARKTTDYALQIVRGLIAAHDRGIVHRDLKPENVFVTSDGHIKLLDFGLAKFAVEPAGAAADARTIGSQTGGGVVLGTVGYMSPEQVRGQAADARSDIFSLGVILYELLAGRRAFAADTTAETLTAILRADPPSLLTAPSAVPVGLARIVEHCLEKDPADRFQSARDIAFAIDAFSGAGSSASAVGVPARARDARAARRFAVAAAAIAGAAILLGAGLVIGRRTGAVAAPPAYEQLTFQRGTVYGARFASDGETIVYAAAWNGKPPEIFSTRAGSTSSRSLGTVDADLLAVSSAGELALRLAPRYRSAYLTAGTLARVMLSGGSPRALEDNVVAADWAPDGKSIAIVRDAGGRMRLEFPAGHVLYETSGWIGPPRFSPDGKALAFMDHQSRAGDPGSVVVVGVDGARHELASGFVSSTGVAWSPDGAEVWFTATRAGAAPALYAVSLRGRERLLARIPGGLTLDDVSRSGRVLLTRDDWRLGIIALAPGQATERDLSYMDFSAIRTLSPDGRWLLFDESGEAGGNTGVAYLRNMDGSAPVRLADATSLSLTPDARLVLAVASQGEDRFLIIPTGTGEPRTMPPSNLTSMHWAAWLPNGREFLVAGADKDHAPRVYRQSIDGGAATPVTPEGAIPNPESDAVSPDGKALLAVDADGRPAVYAIDTGARTAIAGLEGGEEPIGWTGDGERVYAYRPSIPARVFEVDPRSGQRKLWRELQPSDLAGVYYIRSPHISADGRSYAYNYSRLLSDLYLMEGIR